ncbi:hypothetical protein Nmel_010821, partial [Mimus melanotis]
HLLFSILHLITASAVLKEYPSATPVKIDLPTSSQIKAKANPLRHNEEKSRVQLDPGEAEENEKQNMIFFHNSHMHTPKGNCETLTHMKDLFGRMEKHEKEVSELREVCSPQKCCGESQDCSLQVCLESCSSSGICDTARGVCQCYKGVHWTGLDPCSPEYAGAELHGELSVSWDPVTDGDNYLLTYYSAGYEMLVKQIHVPKEQLLVCSQCHLGVRRDGVLPGNGVENLPTDMHYYKLKFRYLVKTDEKQVMMPKSNDPKSKYILSVMDSPKSLVTDQMIEDSATISWDRVQAPVDRYVVRYSSTGGHSKETEVGKDRSIHHPSLGRSGEQADKQLFVLQGLEQGVRYTVCDGLQGDHQSRTEHSFSTVPLSIGASRGEVPPPALLMDRFSHSVHTVSFLYQYPMECSQVQQNRNASSSMYTIYLNGDGSRLLQCDLSTDGGGWILTLTKLHDLMSSSSICYELRVDLWTASESVCAMTSSRLPPAGKGTGCQWGITEAMLARRALGSKDLPQCLGVHNMGQGCGSQQLCRDAPWGMVVIELPPGQPQWEARGEQSQCLTPSTWSGHFSERNSLVFSHAVSWESWKGHEFFIPFTEMKICPQSFSNEAFLGRRKSLSEERKKIRA